MKTRTLLGILALLGLAASPALGQAPPGGPGGGPPDFAQMRQRFLDMMRQSLGASDDEFKVLLPKIEKVQQLQRDANARGGMFMMFGGRGPGGGGPGGPGGPGAGPGGPGGPGGGGFGGPGGDQTPSEVQQKMMDLRETLDNKDSKPEDVKAKLQALRDARAQAKADVVKAQGELRDLLTSKQEAVMVMMGVLE